MQFWKNKRRPHVLFKSASLQVWQPSHFSVCWIPTQAHIILLYVVLIGWSTGFERKNSKWWKEGFNPSFTGTYIQWAPKVNLYWQGRPKTYSNVTQHLQHNIFSWPSDLQTQSQNEVNCMARWVWNMFLEVGLKSNEKSERRLRFAKK